jgi:hypothetical protein
MVSIREVPRGLCRTRPLVSFLPRPQEVGGADFSQVEGGVPVARRVSSSCDGGVDFGLMPVPGLGQTSSAFLRACRLEDG